MRLDIRTIITAATLCAAPLVAGCGSKDKAGGNIQMKDMEVVDGTATDAMTDLDGVQGEGTAIAPSAANASNAGEAAPAPQDAKPKAAAAGDAEILSDQ
ncbi:hypothetical protein WG907_03675 [Sphingobium sp. AN558]|uniref:hypothetical protein n=1 Tax=Sphingobium sp. AN558 TaxID=3133442 RepID=UPI0030C09F06